MTLDERRLVRHALGLPNARNHSFRNWYGARGGSPEAEAWAAMAAKGWANDCGIAGGLHAFRATRVGAFLALGRGEQLDPHEFERARA